MKNLLFWSAAAALLAIPAWAQSEREGWPIKLRTGSVTFTTTGSYSETTTRLIGVTVRTDNNEDGKMERGDLRVTCSGGKVVSLVFVPHDPNSPTRPVQDVSASAQTGTPGISASTTFKGHWDLGTNKSMRQKGRPKIGEATEVRLEQGQPNLCA